MTLNHLEVSAAQAVDSYIAFSIRHNNPYSSKRYAVQPLTKDGNERHFRNTKNNRLFDKASLHLFTIILVSVH